MRFGLKQKSKSCPQKAKEKLLQVGYDLKTAYVIGREVVKTTAGLLLLHALFPKKVMPEYFDARQRSAARTSRTNNGAIIRRKQ